MITLNNLKKSYKTDEIETVALNNINLSINQGDFVAIMGPSGCGKSTLLNILGMLDDFDEGSYSFNGNEVSSNQNEKMNLRKGNIGFVFQSFNLIDELTIFENVELPLIYLGYNKKERKELVMDALSKMKIEHRAKHYPGQLSGGQQQRAAISRAVVTNPKVILADEPTGNLDSENGLQVMKLLTDLNSEGTTVIMVTHSERDAKYADRVINLFDGKVVTPAPVPVPAI